MAATRRLQKELTDLGKSASPEIKCVKDLRPDQQSILKWTGKILPSKAPYDKGAFAFEVNFPAEYPFKPPKLLMKTRIYHPNIDEKGQIWHVVSNVIRHPN